MDYVIFYYFKSAHAKSGTVVHACDSDSQQAGGKRIKTQGQLGLQESPCIHACMCCMGVYVCVGIYMYEVGTIHYSVS